MNVIDMLPRLFMNNHGFLGEITVVDLKKDASLTASNSELLYNYNELCKLRSKLCEKPQQRGCASSLAGGRQKQPLRMFGMPKIHSLRALRFSYECA
jgi:hypothetical protein